MTDGTTLLSCPFCGGEAELLTFWDFYRFSCKNTDCTAHVADAPYVQHAEGIWYGSIDEARAAWNQRHVEMCHAESDLSEWVCSNCQCWIPLGLTPENIKYASEWRFCPHCGAKVVK